MRRPFRRSPADPARPRRIPGFSAPITSIILAVSVGIIVLLDLLTDLPTFNAVGALLVEYGIIIAAFALVLGVMNVLTVHVRKIQSQEVGWPFSVVLVLTTIALVSVGLLTGPDGALVQWTLTAILLPLQSAFFSLLAFFLLGVAYRAMRVNSVESLILVGSAVLVILGATPVGTLLGDWLVGAKEYLLAVPATAGARGLLFGVALGTVVTGLRLLFDGHRYFK